MENWQKLKHCFETLLRRYEKATYEIDCSVLHVPCSEAGKAFFETLSENNRFGLGDEFKRPPITENLIDPNGLRYDNEHYLEYWLCVLAHLARDGRIYVANWKLSRTRMPYSWGVLDYEENPFFDDNGKAYVCEVCNGSIQVCEKLLGPGVWQPRPGYIGSKTIVQYSKVPRTTLQAWQERDKPDMDKDPKTHENYYPKEWVQKRLKAWKPKKSVT